MSGLRRYLQRCGQRYLAFWFAPSGGARLAAFRILFALYMLAYFSTLAPNVTMLFSNEGVYVPYRVPDLAPAPLVAALLFYAMIALTLCVLVGYRTGAASGALLLLYLHHYLLQLAVKQSSFERLIILYLAILCFAGAGQRFGLDGEHRPGARVVWAERLIGAQSVLLYTGSGLWKLLNPSWHTGELLRSTFQGMWATPLAFSVTRLGLHANAWTLLSWAIVLLELLLGPLLLMRRTRAVAVLLAITFHLGNCFLLFIPEFLVCVPPLVVFVSEARIERWLAPLWSRVRARMRPRTQS